MDATAAREMAAGGLDAEFWRGLDEDELRLPQCAQCGRWVWPVEVRCAECGSFEWQWTAVRAQGTLYSWTRTWYPFVESRIDQLPYVVTLVELAHAGNSRLLGVLTGDEVGLETGAAVKGSITPGSAATYGLPSVTWSLVGAGGSHEGSAQ